MSYSIEYMATLSIDHTTKTYPRTLPYQAIADAILPRTYTLSLVFIGTTRARTLNQTHRGRDYTPDILSFPLTAHSGEIYICTDAAMRAAPEYPHPTKHHIAFLFIHGLLHLKGYEHGATMEKAEQRFMTRFCLN